MFFRIVWILILLITTNSRSIQSLKKEWISNLTDWDFLETTNRKNVACFTLSRRFDFRREKYYLTTLLEVGEAFSSSLSIMINNINLDSIRRFDGFHVHFTQGISDSLWFPNSTLYPAGLLITWDPNASLSNLDRLLLELDSELSIRCSYSSDAVYPFFFYKPIRPCKQFYLAIHHYFFKSISEPKFLSLLESPFFCFGMINCFIFHVELSVSKYFINVDVRFVLSTKPTQINSNLWQVAISNISHLTFPLDPDLQSGELHLFYRKVNGQQCTVTFTKKQGVQMLFQEMRIENESHFTTSNDSLSLFVHKDLHITIPFYKPPISLDDLPVDANLGIRIPPTLVCCSGVCHYTNGLCCKKE